MSAVRAAGGAKRVFLVVWGFEGFGGLEHHLAELALALAKRGDEVLVFSEAPLTRGNAYVRRLRAAGINITGASPIAGLAHHLGGLHLGPVWRVAVRVLRVTRWVRAKFAPRDRAVSPGEERIIAARGYHPVTADLFRRLDEAVADGAPDVVHVHGTRLRQQWAVAWAATRGLPSVYTEHVTLHEWAGVADPDAVEIMQSRVGALACVSARSRDSLIAAVGTALPVVIVKHIVAAEVAATPIDREGPLRLLIVARLEVIKGVDVLLRAVAIAREAGHAVRLTVAGDGTQRSALHALARALGLTDIAFLGAVAPERVPGLLRAAHVMVLSSRGEGLPVALVEAMGNGRAVIATRSGGIAEVLRDGVTGILVDPESPEQLAAAIARLARDRATVAAMGEAARRAWRDDGWTPEAVLAETDALYRAARVRAGALAGRA
ncbi:hypothetical protein BH09GEM1_BH09GEM1_37840 [soil metagenome]